MEQVHTGQVHKEQICTAQTHMEQSVTYLVRRMTEGDSQAFDQLMGYYYPKVLRMAYLISGNHADSEDILQDAYQGGLAHMQEEPEGTAGGGGIWGGGTPGILGSG